MNARPAMETPDPKLLEDLRVAVLRQIESDSLVLPVLPAVVAKAIVMLRTPDVDLGAVARALEPDPVVVARVVRLANSAGFASRQPAAAIATAVMRLGAGNLGAFLIEVAAQRVFASADPHINRACRRLWEHSIATGLIARKIAATVSWDGTSAGVDAPETAYLAGLLHDIGKPILAGMLLDAERRLRGRRTKSWITPEIWVQLVSDTHRTVGIALARRWELPEVVVEAIEGAGGYDRGDPMSVGNVVVLANAVAKLQGVYVGAVNPPAVNEQVETGRKLFLLAQDALDRLTDDLEADVRGRLG